MVISIGCLVKQKVGELSILLYWVKIILYWFIP